MKTIPFLFIFLFLLITIILAHFDIDNNENTDNQQRKIVKTIIFEKDRHFSSSSSGGSSEEEGHVPRPTGPRPGHGPSPNPPRPNPVPNPGPRPKCEEHWYTSYRPQGIWCLRVGIGHMDYNGAISQCATYGGVLSGIQNDWERMLLANEANRQTLAYNIEYSGMWLGAQRNPGTNTFSWTDGHTTGRAGMVFGPGQPDNSNRDGRGPQNCLQLIDLAPGYWNNPGSWSNWQNGQIDDYWCNQVEDPSNRMYACGKQGPRE